MNETKLSISRPVRSYVLRQGRVSNAQERYHESMMQTVGVPFSGQILDMAELFGREAPCIVEIGFGMGESTAAIAKAHPENNYLGIEVHTPGVGHLLKLVGEQGLQNLRVMNTDAVEILQQRIAPASLDRVQLFFPDPWHKTRHHKRRIVQPDFVALIASRLRIGGVFHMATDWENYAQQMAQVLKTSPDFHNLAENPPYSARPATRPLTKFEHRGLNLGHGVWDLLYTRVE